jgi:ketosteroid isomerase-like protein
MMDSFRTTLLNADRSWNDASLRKGYYRSRMDFVADDGIELNEGDMPLPGKQAITDYALNHSADDSTQKLQWVALKAEVSSSGELDYTYGSYSVQTKTKDGKDTTNYGAYLTVWKRQPDGLWKFLVDAPVSTPHEVK